MKSYGQCFLASTPPFWVPAVTTETNVTHTEERYLHVELNKLKVPLPAMELPTNIDDLMDDDTEAGPMQELSAVDERADNQLSSQVKQDDTMGRRLSDRNLKPLLETHFKLLPPEKSRKEVTPSSTETSEIASLKKAKPVDWCGVSEFARALSAAEKSTKQKVTEKFQEKSKGQTQKH